MNLGCLLIVVFNSVVVCLHSMFVSLEQSVFAFRIFVGSIVLLIVALGLLRMFCTYLVLLLIVGFGSCGLLIVLGIVVIFYLYCRCRCLNCLLFAC